MRSPQNAIILITGAGRGIGKRLALGFAQAGARVGLLGRSTGELDVTKLEIEHAGGTALRLCADVADAVQMTRAVDLIAQTWGAVDVLVANAAVQGHIGPFIESGPASWREVVDTNILGVLNSCHAVLPRMIARRSGKIVVMSGSGATASRPNFALYAASKACIARFTESLAEEIRDHNVQINAMFPGDSYTSMTDEILDARDRVGALEIQHAEQARMTGGVPPEKQIQLAMFLASDRSNHVTGKLIHVHDDWKRLENENCRPDSFTLRRHLK